MDLCKTVGREAIFVIYNTNMGGLWRAEVELQELPFGQRLVKAVNVSSV